MKKPQDENIIKRATDWFVVIYDFQAEKVLMAVLHTTAVVHPKKTGSGNSLTQITLKLHIRSQKMAENSRMLKTPRPLQRAMCVSVPRTLSG